MSIDCQNYNLPGYMNIEFFNKIPKKEFDNSAFKIINVRVTGGTQPGENYSSKILRATLSYCNALNQIKKIGLLLKFLDNIELAKFVRSCGLFPIENEVYTCILPVLKDMLGGEDIAPRLFYYTEEPSECIIFEDAGELGFKLGNAAVGLDEEHCALVLRKLGKFHASSMVFAKRNCDVYKKFNKMSKTKNQKPPDFFLNNIKHLAGLVGTWTGYESFSPKLNFWVQSIQDDATILAAPKANGMNVLAHTDLWTNNVLFKYNEDGKPEAVLFIDFQLSHYSSPGVDLMHFLYTSAEQNVLETRIDVLVEQYYYEAFRTTLLRCNYDYVPPLEDIRESMSKCVAIGFMWTMVQQFLTALSDIVKTEVSLQLFDDPEKGDELRNLGMSSQRFVNRIKYILHEMERVKVFK